MNIKKYRTHGDLNWYGCYDSFRNWKNYVTSLSFAHPAKMSPKLCDRIFKHLIKLGKIKKGDVCCDFMAGQGTTAVVASLNGFDSVLVELESHFIDMIKANKEKCEETMHRKLNWDIIQGDSRFLSVILGCGGFGVTSPPYCDKTVGDFGSNAVRAKRMKKAGYSDAEIKHSCSNAMKTGYGNHEGNIGNLKDKFGVTSPPYENQCPSHDKAENYKGFEHVGSIKSGATGYYTEEKNKNQIGQKSDESYLDAMLKVYSEAFKAGISPLVTVTKNPTREGKLRRLDLDTVKLLELSGYKIFDYHRAILFEEHEYQTLTGETIKKPKGRLSFFKRLSYERGNIVANWEDILFAEILPSSK